MAVEKKFEIVHHYYCDISNQDNVFEYHKNIKLLKEMLGEENVESWMSNVGNQAQIDYKFLSKELISNDELL